MVFPTFAAWAATLPVGYQNMIAGLSFIMAADAAPVTSCWQSELADAAPVMSPPLSSPRQPVALTVNMSISTLIAFDISTGSMRWTAFKTWSAPEVLLATPESGSFIVHHEESHSGQQPPMSKIVSYDALSGQEQWSFAYPWWARDFATDGQVLVATAPATDEHKTYVFVVNVEDGSSVFEDYLDSNHSASWIARHEDLVALCEKVNHPSDPILGVYDTSDGGLKLKWGKSVPFCASAPEIVPAALPTVVVADGKGQAAAYDLFTGEAMWSKDFGQSLGWPKALNCGLLATAAGVLRPADGTVAYEAVDETYLTWPVHESLYRFRPYTYKLTQASSEVLFYEAASGSAAVRDCASGRLLGSAQAGWYHRSWPVLVSSSLPAAGGAAEACQTGLILLEETQHGGVHSPPTATTSVYGVPLDRVLSAAVV